MRRQDLEAEKGSIAGLSESGKPTASILSRTQKQNLRIFAHFEMRSAFRIEEGSIWRYATSLLADAVGEPIPHLR